MKYNLEQTQKDVSNNEKFDGSNCWNIRKPKKLTVLLKAYVTIKKVEMACKEVVGGC